MQTSLRNADMEQMMDSRWKELWAGSYCQAEVDTDDNDNFGPDLRTWYSRKPEDARSQTDEMERLSEQLAEANRKLAFKELQVESWRQGYAQTQEELELVKSQLAKKEDQVTHWQDWYQSLRAGKIDVEGMKVHQVKFLKRQLAEAREVLAEATEKLKEQDNQVESWRLWFKSLAAGKIDVQGLKTDEIKLLKDQLREAKTKLTDREEELAKANEKLADKENQVQSWRDWFEATGKTDKSKLLKDQLTDDTKLRQTEVSERELQDLHNPRFKRSVAEIREVPKNDEEPETEAPETPKRRRRRHTGDRHHTEAQRQWERQTMGGTGLSER